MVWEITLKLELQSTNLSICGFLSLWCFFSCLPWNRGGELVSWGVCAVSEITCMQVIFVPIFLVPWLGKQAHNFCLYWCVQGEGRAGKATLPSASCKYFVSPGVVNLGSFQSAIDAVQVSQPFVLRTRCLTYFQTGMLGHTGIHHICKHSSELRKAFVL